MKKIALVLLAALLALALLSCSANNGGNDESQIVTTAEEISTASESTAAEEPLKLPEGAVKVSVLAGPTGMGAAKLITDSNGGNTTGKYAFDVATSPDTVKASLINGDTDLAAIPTNLAAALYNKTGGEVRVIALNTLGVLYIVTDDEAVNTLSDLRGRTVYATGQGSTPEFILRYVLSENGIDPDSDVDIQFVGEHATLAAMAASGEASVCLLPEPNVTAVLTQNEKMRRIIDLTEEWNAVAGDGSSLTMGCIAVRADFAEKYPDAVNLFLEEYAASVEYVNTNNSEAAGLIAELGIVAKAPVALAALPNCNIVCITGDEMKTSLEGFYGVLMNAQPASIGGALPGEDFYYKK